MPDSFYVVVERKNKRENKTNLGGIKFRTLMLSAIGTQFSRVIK